MTRREVVGQALGAWVLAAARGGSPATVLADQGLRASPDGITPLPLVDLLARIRRKDVSTVDVTEAYLARIERLNPDLNAYVTVTADQARASARQLAARLASGPVDGDALALAGAPIAHKDLFDTAGVRTTGGSRLYAARMPSSDAALVAQLHAAGAVMLGKTNTHELGGGVTTINPFYGTTRNPRDRDRVAGGSSGGSAAAVVAQMAVAATGSDTGGSVRIPAAFCGCVGFKPTHGLIPTRGLLGASPTFDHAGVLARSVADLHPIVDAVLGNTPQPGPARAPSKTARGGVAGLRIGVPRPYFFEGLDGVVARAVEDALTRLERGGADVHDITLPVDTGTMARVFDPIVVAEIQETYADAWRAQPDAFSADFASVFSLPTPSADELAAAHRARRGFADEVDAVFARVELVATPTVPVVALLIDGPIDGARILRHTWPFNASHSPALSVPCQPAGALPVGLQLVGRRSEDRALLAAGAAIEAALA